MRKKPAAFPVGLYSMLLFALCWLTLPGLSGLQAEVIWNNGSMVGCAFARLLNQAVLDLIVSRYRIPQPPVR